MKKTLFLLIISAMIVSCKKNSTTPQYDLKGTWALSSLSTNGNVSTAANFPCLANEKLVFGSDNSATVSWNNSGTCVIDQAQHTTFSGTDGLELNFTRNGNNLYLPQSPSTGPAAYGTITKVSGKLQLTLRDTIRINTAYVTDTTYNSNVYIKQ
jgi:hypothetical protein